MAVSEQASMDAAVRYVVSKYSPKGNWVGWLMMASILVEAWDLYSIAFVLVFIREQCHPEPLLLGLAAAGTQGGAVIGALLGGWLSDKLGRRVMFLSTMWMVIVFALLQAVVPNLGWLVVVRFISGVPSMTIPTMVARPEYRGTASGFAYVFVKVPSFLAIFLFPALFTAIGQAAATLFVAIFPLIGVLAAIFILPEVYGFEQDSEPTRPDAPLEPA